MSHNPTSHLDLRPAQSGQILLCGEYSGGGLALTEDSVFIMCLPSSELFVSESIVLLCWWYALETIYSGKSKAHHVRLLASIIPKLV